VALATTVFFFSGARAIFEAWREVRRRWVVSQDGNGYIPDGYWPPVPASARSKSYPSGYPYPQTGRKFIPYQHPMGNPHPTIYPSSHTKI